MFLLQAMESFSSTTFGQIVAGVIVGVILGFPVFVTRWGNKHVAKPLKRVPVIETQVTGLQAQLTDLSQRFRPMEEQFLVNHGHSLRDSNDRTELLVRETANRVGVNADIVAPPIQPE